MVQTASSASNDAGHGEEGAISLLDAAFDDPVKNEGLGRHGCQHYRRRCRIRAPCCGEVFDCRHCHNEAQTHRASREQHEIQREQVQTVLCCLCNTEQEVQQFCSTCGVCMGQHFCPICKFFDDDTSKEQFHCGECGICRVGGRDKFFHCQICGCCYALSLRNNHQCVESAMKHNCPICFEYLFDSLQPTSVLERCGHTLHSSCLTQLLRSHAIPSCPICAKSIGDQRELWALMDAEVANTPMPSEYESRMVTVLCNDCGASSTVQFHVLGLKCLACGSYNTQR